MLSRGLIAVLIAQFLSALADNALLFAAIALLNSLHSPEWMKPMLQEAFVVAFILLAPFVGAIADSFPKGSVMLFSNFAKFFGATAMLIGLNPLIAYNIVGIGAAMYSPSKYGILGELVSPDKLVKANSLLEGSTIVAILLGAICGGMLADKSVNLALTSVAGCYLLASVANYFIPKIEPLHKSRDFKVIDLAGEFFTAFKSLFKDSGARASLLGTSIFWGAGSTLRFLLVAWVPFALHISDLKTPANLSGAVAIGIAVGAALASAFISLSNIKKVFPAGIAIGLLITLFAFQTNIYAAIAVLIGIGISGGFYVVPLNALLQERGHESVGAGRAIAVQNFVENSCMLLMIGLYILLEKAGLDPISTTVIFGLTISTGIAIIKKSSHL